MKGSQYHYTIDQIQNNIQENDVNNRNQDDSLQIATRTAPTYINKSLRFDNDIDCTAWTAPTDKNFQIQR